MSLTLTPTLNTNPNPNPTLHHVVEKKNLESWNIVNKLVFAAPRIVKQCGNKTVEVSKHLQHHSHVMYNIAPE